MKKSVLLIMLLAAALLLSACAGGTPAATNPPATKAPATSAPVTDAPAASAGDAAQPLKAEKPILMTSAGQSADVQMLYAVANKSGLEAEVRAVAEAEQLDAGAYKTLVIAVGGSSKGLGAAGIDADQELVRVQKIIDKFKDSCTIIVAHIGGQARRGELSDRFITATLPFAQYILVVKGGDDDGLFAAAAAKQGVPMEVCESISTVGESLKKLFE